MILQKTTFTLPNPVEQLKIRVLLRAKTIITHNDHFLPAEFSLFPSAHRYLPPPKRTNHYSESFLPIRMLMAE